MKKFLISVAAPDFDSSIGWMAHQAIHSRRKQHRSDPGSQGSDYNELGAFPTTNTKRVFNLAVAH